MTLKEFTIQNNIKFNWRNGAPYNENFKDSDGYMCKLVHNKHQFTFPFYKGMGHNGTPPDVLEVLECLQSDCQSADYLVDDFLNEMGYNHSLKAVRNGEKIYKQIQRTYTRLNKLFNSHFKDFLQSDC
jgi:hypothetical protein